MKKLLIAMTLLALSGLANSATVTLDFEGLTGSVDGYSDQGVTFTQEGPNGSLDFATSSGQGIIRGGDSIFRADFATPTSFVSFDIATREPHFLNAFDSGDNLLTTLTIHTGIHSERRTLSLSEIAYITVHSVHPDVGIYFDIDNFTFDVPPSAVPIPAAAILFAPALLGFMGLRRRAKKQA